MSVRKMLVKQATGEVPNSFANEVLLEVWELAAAVTCL
jgi:hypothetical protein